MVTGVYAVPVAVAGTTHHLKLDGFKTTMFILLTELQWGGLIRDC